MNINVPLPVRLPRLMKLVLISVAMISIVVLPGCSRKTAKKETPPKLVHTSDAILHKVPAYVDAIGNTKSYYDVDIKAQVTGEVLSYHFQEGQLVKKGDLLFKIDSRPYQAALNQAQSEQKLAEAGMLLSKYVTKSDQPLAQQGIMATQSYATVATTLAKSNAELSLTTAKVWQAQINLDFCNITSPIDGITGYRKVDPGNVVPANTGPTLVNVKSITPLYVDFTIPEDNFNLLIESMKKGKLMVFVSSQEYNIKEATFTRYHLGYLEMIDNYISTGTGMIPLRGVVQNDDRELWPGQFVNVILVFSIKDNSLLVPYQSVQQGLKGDYLFTVDKDNKAHLHWVNKGLKQLDYIEILSNDNNDIKEGDQIVTVGQMGLIDGDTVNVIQKDSFNPPTWAFAQQLLNTKHELNKE